MASNTEDDIGPKICGCNNWAVAKPRWQRTTSNVGFKPKPYELQVQGTAKPVNKYDKATVIKAGYSRLAPGT